MPLASPVPTRPWFSGGKNLLLAALLLQGWPWLDRNKGPEPVYPPIVVTPAWVAEQAASNKLQIVDARSAAAYRIGHVRGALSIDARRAPGAPAQLGPIFVAAGIDERRPVVIYSDHQDAAAAGLLFWRFELAGHQQVRLLDGGLERWRKEARPIATGLAKHEPAGRFSARPDTSRIADRNYVRRHFGRAGFTILDWRSKEAWDRGHIPHSLPMSPEEYVASDGRYLTGPEMRAILAALGPRDHDPIDLRDELIVCGGDSAGQIPITPYLVARIAGVPRVRVYPGGYDDWIVDPTTPRTHIVPATEVHRLLADRADPAVLLDLRGDGDYASGHLPGARLLRPDQFEAQFDSLVAAVWPRADKTRTPLIVYCYGPTCIRSRNASTAAAHRGWRRLYWFREATLGWRQAGYELTTGSKP